MIIWAVSYTHLVDYWDELKEIMEWTKTHVTSTLHLCWGAQAGIYYHYGIDKTQLPEKMFGVFKHHVRNRRIPLVRGLSLIHILWDMNRQRLHLRKP